MCILHIHNRVIKKLSENLIERIKSIAGNTGVILLYHSVAETIPNALDNTLHNVSPEVFAKHLQQLSEHFNFVPLKEFAQANEKKGLATITFDDGYKNVLENALPILESLNYSFSIFLNPLTFTGKFNWRDKVRYLIRHDLIDEFEQNYQFDYKQGRFYRYSKHPKNNSAVVDQALDKFLRNHKIDIYGDYPYLQQTELVNHPLISYGNHSFNHYVLASLSAEQQEFEIKAAKNSLNVFSKHQISDSFSAPFGGLEDINTETVSILQSLDYKDLLMSRQRLQPNHANLEKIRVLERFMPRSDNILGEIVGLSAH